MIDPAAVAATLTKAQRAEWEHVASVIMRWPRKGVCTPIESQRLVEGINERLRAHLENDNAYQS